MNVIEAMKKVMEELGPIAKTRVNETQGYQYRGIDDLYNEINRLHAKYGIVTVPIVSYKKTERFARPDGRLAFYTEIRASYRVYGPDGSWIKAVVTADGLDNSDKGVYKALSGAHKYLLIQLYCIPTGEGMDAEKETIEVEAQVAEEGQEPVPSREASEVIQALRAAKTVKDLEQRFYEAVKRLKAGPDKVAVFKEFEGLKKKFQGGGDDSGKQEEIF
jgi:hypothetical protein